MNPRRDAAGHVCMLHDEKLWPIRELYGQLKYEGVNLYGLKPVKKDRRRICNRYKKYRMRMAETSWYKQGHN